MDTQEKNVVPSVATVDTPEFRTLLSSMSWESRTAPSDAFESALNRVIAHIDSHVAAQVAAKDAEIARMAAKVAEMDTLLGQRPCRRDRCAEYAALSAQAAAPVAYLRFRAAQQWSGVGGSDIEYAEWYETCQAHEIGDDKRPAFPVYVVRQPSPAPVAMTDEQIEDLWAITENLDPIIGVPTYRRFARAILAAQQEAV